MMKTTSSFRGYNHGMPKISKPIAKAEGEKIGRIMKYNN